MPWVPSLVPDLHLLTLTLALLALLLAVAALLRSRRRVRSSAGDDVAALNTRLAASEAGLESLRQYTESLARHVTGLEEKQLLHLQRLALVRFRAFPEVGSDLSFSLALLDACGNGVILTSLFGRSETRIYAKPVHEGKSPYRLTPEEEEALGQALNQPPAPQTTSAFATGTGRMRGTPPGQNMVQRRD